MTPDQLLALLRSVDAEARGALSRLHVTGAHPQRCPVSLHDAPPEIVEAARAIPGARHRIVIADGRAYDEVGVPLDEERQIDAGVYSKYRSPSLMDMAAGEVAA